MARVHCRLKMERIYMLTSVRRYNTISLVLLKKEELEELEERRRIPNLDFLLLAVRT